MMMALEIYLSFTSALQTLAALALQEEAQYFPECRVDHMLPHLGPNSRQEV